MGAWIETLKDLKRSITSVGSHPVWVRGLKLNLLSFSFLRRLSHPVWVRGLKLANMHGYCVAVCRTLYGCVD